ncbi:MAG: gamma-glutamyl-gamma-aminobutyrate hydrolase family protein [Alphaproteobacteria bacterium]
MADRPVIGLTLDSETKQTYSSYPWYAVRQNYCAAVVAAGGLPVALPHEPDRADAYLDLLDGLIVTGGAFDVDPALFGAAERHVTVTTKDRRTAFELAIARGALARDMPVLGICGGQQLLHVALGGTLIQHIPDAVAHALAHEQPNPRHEAGHPVAVKPGTLLHRIAGTETLQVNSAHHQAAADEPDGVVVNATAPDGVIEGIEAPGYRFCLGVQWHPGSHLQRQSAAVAALVAGVRRWAPGWRPLRPRVEITGTWSLGLPQSRCILDDRTACCDSTRRQRHPDVVEPAAAVAGAPVLGAIAPLAVDLFVRRDEVAHGIDPAAGLAPFLEQVDLHRRVADHVQQLLVRPDVAFQRGHVEVADQHAPRVVVAVRLPPLRLGLHEVEFVGELVVLGRVGNVAAGRHINRVDLDAGHRSVHVAAVLPVAPVAPAVAASGSREDQGDAVMNCGYR